MKRLLLAAFLALGFCASLPAQQTSLQMFSSSAQPSTSATSSSFHFALVPELAPPPSASTPFSTYASSAAALPNAPAPPQRSSSSEILYSWDLAVGYEYVHFDSAPFTSNLHGLHTDLTYNLNDWFGLEGSLVSAFGSDVFRERSKYVLYTVGGRISAGQSSLRFAPRLTPWAHVLVGGAHLNPQLANQSKNGFALQLGGGADWRYTERLSFRAEADYVRTMLYSDSQNNFQIGIGAVLHF